nr:serine/threonine protein kinase [Planctomycetota bacterium]
MSDPGQTVQSDFARAATGPLPAVPISSLPDFRFGRRIGAGGMGVVVMGERISDGRPVAIKLLRADLVDDPEFRERFRREVAVMRAVEHPNVVGILDAGEHQGWLYLATELMRDGDLAAYQRRRGSLLAKDALTMAIKIGRGLAAIHRAGLIHRDVKPQNVFLDHRAADGGDVKVGDLGMARSASGDDRMTMTGAACGTPTYMAPEQVRGLTDLDGRVDVYALGTLLWTLLAGREPFIGDTVFVVTEAVLNQPAPDLARFATGMPSGTVEVVRKAMAKDRAQRYATMDELVTDLERLIAGERPVQAGVVAAPPPVTAAPAMPKAAARIAGGGGGGIGLGGGGLRLTLQALAVLVLL